MSSKRRRRKRGYSSSGVQRKYSNIFTIAVLFLASFMIFGILSSSLPMGIFDTLFAGDSANDGSDKPGKPEEPVISFDEIRSNGSLKMQYLYDDASAYVFNSLNGSSDEMYCSVPGEYNIIIRDYPNTNYKINDKGFVFYRDSYSSFTRDSYINPGYKMNLPLSDFTYALIEFDVGFENISGNKYTITPDFRDSNNSGKTNFTISYENFGYTAGDITVASNLETDHFMIFVSSSGEVLVYLNGKYFCNASSAYSDGAVYFNGFKVAMFTNGSSPVGADLMWLDNVNIYSYSSENDSLVKELFESKND